MSLSDMTRAVKVAISAAVKDGVRTAAGFTKEINQS